MPPVPRSIAKTKKVVTDRSGPFFFLIRFDDLSLTNFNRHGTIKDGTNRHSDVTNVLRWFILVRENREKSIDWKIISQHATQFLTFWQLQRWYIFDNGGKIAWCYHWTVVVLCSCDSTLTAICHLGWFIEGWWFVLVVLVILTFLYVSFFREKDEKIEVLTLYINEMRD